jgi:hypothetical protein
MYTYSNKQPFNTALKYNMTALQEVDWDSIPSTTGTFDVSLTKTTGEVEKLPVVEGTLLNVVVELEKLNVSEYTTVDVVQLTLQT